MSRFADHGDPQPFPVEEEAQGSVVEWLARDSRVLSIGGGATEVMLEEVAKRFTPE